MLKITDSNVTVMITDMDRAVKFYQSLGLSLKQRWENHYAMLQAAGVTIGLHPGKKAGSESPDMSIGFMIEKAEEARALLKKLNISYTENDDKGAGTILGFKDPDGNWLYFNEPAWK